MQNKANKETLYNILDSLDTPIYVSDPDTYELLYVNRKLRSIYGVADPRGETCWKLLGQTTAPCPDCPCPELKKNPSKAIVAEGKNPQNNHTYSRTDTFIDWHDGRVVHMRHSTDVTDARMSRERVEKYIKELELATLNSERANNAKRDFLSRMSHEIRTPMNAIIGMAHIAGTSSDQEKVKRCIEKINSSSKQLLSIINDILDMSNIEAAKFELSNEKFDLEKMLIDVCNLITAKAEERQQNFQISIDKDVEKYYVGDSMRLSQVIINLLTNAVKFSPENSDILLNISKISAGEKNATLKFEVIDHGIGISRENLAKLFVPFEQGDGSISRRYGGTGLGLAICKSIVNLMNGNISAESEEGRGSKFTFTVDLEEDKISARATLSKAAKKKNLSVLVADDSYEIREFFKSLLGESGISVDVADSGERALELVDAAVNEGRNYDVAFIDWRMPGLDGIQTAELMKAKYNLNSLIVLISIAQINSVEPRLKSAGITKFLAKPLFPSSIIDILNEITGVPQRTAGSRQIPDFSGCRILIAEDVEINAEIVTAILEPTGAEIVIAGNGKKALDTFSSDDNFDMILMDIHMPVMDGYAATAAIRGLPKIKAKEIPIIAMTANVFKEDVMRCLSTGMNDHIPKPIDEHFLMTTLSKYLAPKKRAASGIEKSTVTAAGDITDAAGFLPYIDTVGGLARLCGNKKLFARLLKNFNDNTSLAPLKDALSNDDTARAKDLTHSIKGTSANLSLTSCYQAALNLETQLNTNKQYSAALEALDSTLKTTRIYVDKLINRLSEN